MALSMEYGYITIHFRKPVTDFSVSAFLLLYRNLLREERKNE